MPVSVGGFLGVSHMKLAREFACAVAIGGWNANILLDRDWLKRYLFDDYEGEFKVELPLPSYPPQPPRITAGKVRFSVIGRRLSLEALQDTPDAYDCVAKTMEDIANLLPHTPVNSMGMNFLFDLDTTDRDFGFETDLRLADIARNVPFDEEDHRFAVKHDDCTLNLRLWREQNGRHVEFNYHYALDDISGIKAALSDRPLSECRKQAETELARLLENLEQDGTDE